MTELYKYYYLMGERTRPAAVKQPPLPPWDPSDSGGDVHTVPPPELVIPKTGTSRDFWRGDIVGRCVDFIPPYVDGANTTPPNMVMSFFLPLYDRKVQDGILTSHAEAGYDKFVLARPECDRAGLTPSRMADLVAYVQSWGFHVGWWATGSQDDRSNGQQAFEGFISPILRAFISRGQSFLDNLIVLPGEELNNGCPPGPTGADALINGTCSMVNPYGVPVWLHFTSNYPGWPLPPPDGNIDAALVVWWQQWIGKVRGLAWQGDQNQSAGLMGAKMYDSRRILGRADPSFLLAAWELMASNQFMGRCTEEYGCLRSLEMVYCPKGDSPNMVYGGCNGFGRLPDGTVV